MQDETNIRQHRTTQACDACKLRKVRCHGATRYWQCGMYILRSNMTPAWLESKHRQLQLSDSARYELVNLSDMQQADLIIALSSPVLLLSEALSEALFMPRIVRSATAVLGATWPELGGYSSVEYSV